MERTDQGICWILTRVDGSEDLPANRQSWCGIRVSREDPRDSSVVPWVADRKSGGDEETRTPDPLLAKEMLCQLSYVPAISAPRSGGRTWTRTRDLGLIRAAL